MRSFRYATGTSGLKTRRHTCLFRDLEPERKSQRSVWPGRSLFPSGASPVASRDSGEELDSDLDARWRIDNLRRHDQSRHGSLLDNQLRAVQSFSTQAASRCSLTSGADSYSRPAFRPDGRALYAMFTVEANGKVYNLDRLAKFSWPNSGKPVILTCKLGSLDWQFRTLRPDSKSIYLTAEEAGNEKLFTMPADGGEVTLAMDMTRGVYTGLKIPARAAATLIVANWESAMNPPEVFRLDLKSKTQIALTNFNTDQVAKIDWQPLRHFWFTSKAGKRIHNMIALPPNFDENKKYPLLVLMHGGPNNMWRDNWGLRWNYYLLARPGYVVLLTNYSGSTGFGEKFAQSIQGDPFAGPGNEINEGADEAIRLYHFVDGSRQAAAGASYGGHLANWLQATTTRYKCLDKPCGFDQPRISMGHQRHDLFS